MSLVVVRPGFEPGKAEPKSAVLPLHHRTKAVQTYIIQKNFQVLIHNKFLMHVKMLTYNA